MIVMIVVIMKEMVMMMGLLRAQRVVNLQKRNMPHLCPQQQLALRLLLRLHNRAHFLLTARTLLGGISSSTWTGI